MTSAFTALERNAIAVSSKADPGTVSENQIGKGLVNNKVFCLDVVEMQKAAYGFCNMLTRAYGIGYRFLRSPYVGDGETSSTQKIGVVTDFGFLQTNATNNAYVSPAMNLDLSSVLFTSAAEGGKTTGIYATNELPAIASKDNADWKFTLKDTVNQHVTLEAFTQTGNVLHIPYSNASYGTNQYLSAIITDAAGNNITHYGKLKKIDTVSDASGTVTMVLPNGFDQATMCVKIFSEQENGDKYTDYASEPQNLSGITDVSSITSVTAQMLIYPTPGAAFPESVQVDSGEPYSAVSGGITWKDENTEIVTGSFRALKTYTVEVQLQPKSGFYFPGELSTITASLNSLNAQIKSVDLNGVLTISLTLPRTEQINTYIGTWPTAGSITYGQPLYNSHIDTSGADSSGTGTYTWKDSTIKPIAGATDQVMVYTPNNTDFKTVEHAVSVTVAKSPVTVTLTTDKTDTTRIGDTIHLTAALSSLNGTPVDGTVTFKQNGSTIVSGSAITISGDTASCEMICISGDNTLSVQYSGSSNYEPSTGEITGFNVLKKNQEPLSISHVSDKYYGDTSFSIASMVSGGSGSGDLTYSSENPAIATIDNTGTITITGVGSTRITVTKAGDEDYNQSQSTAVILRVNKAQNPFSISCETTAYPDTPVPNTITSPNETPVITYYYKQAGAEDSTYSTAAPVLAGHYTVKAVASETAHYQETDSNPVDFLYTRATYTVSFETNHGSGVTSQVILDGEKAILPETPIYSGYTFGGWYKEAVLSNIFDFTSEIIHGDITLYGKWIRNAVPISNGNNVQSSTNYTSTDNKKEDVWTKAKSELSNTEDSADGIQPKAVVIPMSQSGTTILPSDILNGIKGKNINLKLDLGNDIVWTINGTTITGDNIRDTDFGLIMDTKEIPEKLIKEVTKKASHIEIGFTHEGEFGFEALLNLKVDKSNQGKYVSLFYYNKKKAKLEFLEYAKIDTEGNVQLTFHHTSSYVMVIDDKPEVVDDILMKSTINVSKVTLYANGTKKRTKTLKVVLPNVINQMIKEGLVKSSITYKSSNKKIATISATGKITAKKSGTATITTTIKVGDKLVTYKTKVIIKSKLL